MKEIRWKASSIAVATLELMALWLLFTWRLELLSVVLGFVFSLGLAIASRDFFLPSGEQARFSIVRAIPLLPMYFLMVIWNIFFASVKLALQTITMDIDPEFVSFRTRLRSQTARVFLANSITLTPSTITVELEDDKLLVHCLGEKRLRRARRTETAIVRYRSQAAEAIAGPFERMLRIIWRETA